MALLTGMLGEAFFFKFPYVESVSRFDRVSETQNSEQLKQYTHTVYIEWVREVTERERESEREWNKREKENRVPIN